MRFPDRSLLNAHHQNHQIGQGGLHPDPYNDENGPWVRPGAIDESLRRAYLTNRAIILERSREGSVQSIYNFPVDNDITVEQLMQFANQVYTRQTRAFKLNLNFGYVMRHRDNGTARYFKPFEHEGVFEFPIYISCRRDLEKLERALHRLNLLELLLMQREDTKWVVELLTNVRFTVYKTKFLLGNPNQSVPNHIKNSKSIFSLVTDKRTGKMFNDNLCAFRCLALHQGYDLKNLEAPCLRNYKVWERAREPKLPFQGLQLEEDIPTFEKCFQTNVEIFSLDEDGVATIVYSSLGKFPTTMRLNLSGDHLSYIHNFQLYSKQYQCKFCLKIWQSSSSCKRHSDSCESKDKLVYPGRFVSINQHIFDLLKDVGINTKNDHYPWFIVYDFEAIQPPVRSEAFEPVQKPVQGEDQSKKEDKKLEYLREHIPVSVSVCSNVPGYTEPKCFINLDPDQLVQDMVDYMDRIAYDAYELAQERWARELTLLGAQVEGLSEQQVNDLRANLNDDGEKQKDEKFSLLCKLEGYMKQIPVLGFCSSKYDINLVKEKLLVKLKLHETEEDAKRHFVIKKCNSYVCISSQNFRFLDMAQYLAPNSTYDSFLKAFKVPKGKGFFPYEWFDDYSKLDATCLPGREKFYNSFKNEELSQENYDKCLTAWQEEGMKTFKDFLIWYNNLDVGPFVTAIERWQKQYFDEGLDVFKTAISLPGLARQKLYRYAMKNNAQFSLFDKGHADLHELMTKNLFGGPSIIFHRHAESGVTKIRGDKLVEKIFGYDSNALYVWCLDQSLTTGVFVRRKAEDNFKPQIRDVYIKAFAWLEYLNETSGSFIRHLRNTGSEKQIGPYPVDGFDAENRVVYQFQGCYFHGHSCEMTKGCNAEWQAGRPERFERTQFITSFIESQGFEVVEMWECQFKKLCRSNRSLREKINDQRPEFYKSHRNEVTEKQILDGVVTGQLFGFVQCDLGVPEKWGKGFENFSNLTPYEYFKEMSPIFCTTEVPYESFGKHMQNYVEENKLKKNSRMLLVGGMSAKEILIATPLLQWYLEHGIVVSKIHQVVEYQKKRCFEGLAKEITEARRAGDIDPDMEIMANTKKNEGNNCYGALCLDKTRHSDHKYFKGSVNASQAVNEPGFRKLTCLNEEKEFYEVQFAKYRIVLDVPIQLAVFVLNLAKLRLLDFTYRGIDRLVDRSDYMLLETDTDSLYLAFSKSTLEEVVKPHLKEEFLRKTKGQCRDGSTPSLEFFPRSCCQTHALFDMREPGVFKTEFVGDEMIGLCSKTYFVENRAEKRAEKKFKLSCKGINKKLVKDPKQIFKNVLKLKEPQTAHNRGIRAKGNTMYTYKQSKTGFNYFYVKRKVLEDGVSTEPLDLVLKPAKKVRRGQTVEDDETETGPSLTKR